MVGAAPGRSAAAAGADRGTRRRHRPAAPGRRHRGRHRRSPAGAARRAGRRGGAHGRRPRRARGLGARAAAAASGASTRCTGRRLSLWEQATGQGYESGPAGRRERRAQRRAGARADPGAVRPSGTRWPRGARCPRSSTSLELGVGNGNQAKVWLDEFRALDREHGRRLLPPPALPDGRLLAARARAGPRRRSRDHAEHVSSLVLDATRPTETLGFLRYKAFLVYISNVYDNLPTDEIARIGGRIYQVEIARLPAATPTPSAGRRASGSTPDRAARRWSRAAAARARSCWPRPHPTSFADAGRPRSTFWRRGLGGAAAGGALRAAGRARHSTRSRPASAASCCGRSSSPAATSACTSATAPRPASPTPCRCCTRYGVLQCHDLFVTDVAPVPDRLPRPRQVRRLGRQLGQRPAAGARSAAAQRLRRAASRPFAHRHGRQHRDA